MLVRFVTVPKVTTTFSAILNVQAKKAVAYTGLHFDGIGLNRPALGGTVPNYTTMSRRPALLTFCPAFTVLGGASFKVTGYCCGRAKWLFLTWCY